MTNVHRIDTNLTLDAGYRSSSASAAEEWQSFKILFHGFADLPSAFEQFTLSPEFKCNGHRWCIKLYPGGKRASRTGCLSLYLRLCSGGYATAPHEVSILDKYQNVKHTKKGTDQSFHGGKIRGWKDYSLRSYILLTENILDDNGTLAIVVSINRKNDSASPFVPINTTFVPSNPMSSLITSMLLDEETADVCFEVGSADVHDVDEAASSPVTFHAHRLILKKCAPMLASLFGSYDEEIVAVSITDVKPAIFRHLLHYVYGGSVPGKEMNAHAKDIINAADKYSIVNLKLEAEAAYVNSTKITMDNAMDNLLYADALNLALLKEAVMDFLAENTEEASERISFSEVPGHVMKDLLVAFSRTKKTKQDNQGDNNNFTVMRVNELRMKLDEKGLNVDGSREAMIETLKGSANEFADDDDSLEE
ncbi:BTB/POZ and MATH domain-containing protein [Skeletonema marinoi]|uniref:BTB/POZ and MATH domain-containing protein n=1 Tax=Skeletonema marinoi TaxID=267567 RepID=A0AAD9DB64_9STRA|nr:BTB/POZ and MATH domain-containing protein [Skeletonema marinoi]